MRVVEKHMQMEEKMQRFKETKAHLIEYHRIANEFRLQRGAKLGSAGVH